MNGYQVRGSGKTPINHHHHFPFQAKRNQPRIPLIPAGGWQDLCGLLDKAKVMVKLLRIDFLASQEVSEVS
jgi:hypothetical protein